MEKAEHLPLIIGAVAIYFLLSAARPALDVLSNLLIDAIAEKIRKVRN